MFGTIKSNKTINNYHITLEHISWHGVISFLSKNVQMLILKNQKWTKNLTFLDIETPPVYIQFTGYFEIKIVQFFCVQFWLLKISVKTFGHFWTLDPPPCVPKSTQLIFSVICLKKCLKIATLRAFQERFFASYASLNRLQTSYCIPCAHKLK